MQNKCLKDSSMLEGLAETQQSQYKPDVSQQVLGGEMCSLRVWECSGGTLSSNTGTVTIKEGGSRLSKNFPTELMPFFKAPPSFILLYFNRALMRCTQHLACVKKNFQHRGGPRTPKTLQLFYKGKQGKVCDDFATKIWSILRLTMILKMFWPPQNQNTEVKFNPG